MRFLLGVVCVVVVVNCAPMVQLSQQPSDEMFSIMNGSPQPPTDLQPFVQAPTTTNTTTTTESNRMTKTLLVAIPSAPQNYEKRMGIRSSWMHVLDTPHLLTASDASEVTIKFFIGIVGGDQRESIEASIQQESDTYHDIIRLDSFTESYYNLTLKTLAMISYADTNRFPVMVKCDDDTFLRVDKLYRLIMDQPSLDTLYMGHAKSNVVPYPNPSHKWYMKDQYNETEYPLYMAGPMYLLGTNPLHYLATATDLPEYRLEDVAVGIYTRSLTLERVNIPTDMYVNGCHTQSVAINSLGPDEQVLMWESLLSVGRVCPGARWAPRVCVDEPCMCNPLPDGVESCN